LQKLPAVSGKKLVKVLCGLGYQILRQKGSHMRLRKTTGIGEHNITVPMHREIAKGTLNDILSRISLWNGLSKEKLAEILNE